MHSILALCWASHRGHPFPGSFVPPILQDWSEKLQEGKQMVQQVWAAIYPQKNGGHRYDGATRRLSFLFMPQRMGVEADGFKSTTATLTGLKTRGNG